MKSRNAKLVREQLENTLRQFRILVNTSIPQKGWVRALRDALGMSGRQLAQRLGVQQQRVTEIEQNEVHGAITIKTLRRVAKALDCVFVYGFVPRTNLEDTVKRQAEFLVRKRMNRVSHTMLLENQQLSHEEEERIIHEKVEDLINSMPRSLWDKI